MTGCGTGDILSSSASTQSSASVDNSVSTQTGITDCSVKCSINADGLVEATHSCNGSEQMVEEFTFVPPECVPMPDAAAEAAPVVEPTVTAQVTPTPGDFTDFNSDELSNFYSQGA